MHRSASNGFENQENKSARNNRNFVRKGGNVLVQHSPVKQHVPAQTTAMHAQPQRGRQTA